jgi:hypothetical protein
MNEVIVHRNVALLNLSDARFVAHVRSLLPLDEYVLATVSDHEFVVDPARLAELNAALTNKGLNPLHKKLREG